MPSRTSAVTARAMATALSTPVGRELINGGFGTFTPRLRALGERIRHGVREGQAAAVPARAALYEAFQRRDAGARRGELRVLAGAKLGTWDVDLLVSYRDRWGVLDIVDGSGASVRARGEHAVGLDLVAEVYPDEVTDAQAADKVVEHFLRDLAIS